MVNPTLKAKTIVLPNLHGCMLHGRVSKSSPTDLVLVPPPQSLLHADHGAWDRRYFLSVNMNKCVRTPSQKNTYFHNLA